jgi:hypothetical protein
MTLSCINPFVFLNFCAFLGVLDQIGDWYFGTPGGLICANAGLVFGVAIFVFRGSIFDALLWLFPLRPKCSNGNCQQEDYTWCGPGLGGDVYQCTCGEMYLMKGKRFFKIDGEDVVPFMRKTWLGQWVVDSGNGQHD